MAYAEITGPPAQVSFFLGPDNRLYVREMQTATTYLVGEHSLPEAPEPPLPEARVPAFIDLGPFHGNLNLLNDANTGQPLLGCVFATGSATNRPANTVCQVSQFVTQNFICQIALEPTAPGRLFFRGCLRPNIWGPWQEVTATAVGALPARTKPK